MAPLTGGNRKFCWRRRVGISDGISSEATKASHPPPESYWNVPADHLLETLQSTPGGLGADDAERRRDRYGPNTLPDRARVTWLRIWLGQFRSPLMLILVFAAVVALLVHDVANAVTVPAIVLGSALLGFVQEYRANTAMEQLRARIMLEVTVMRDGVRKRLPAHALVLGDVVILSAGALIPEPSGAAVARIDDRGRGDYAAAALSPVHERVRIRTATGELDVRHRRDHGFLSWRFGSR